MKKFYPRKQIKRMINSRLFVTVLLILVQMLFLFVLADLLANVHLYVNLFLRIISIAAALWILTRPDNPSYKISWILAIFLTPLVGGLFYLIFGNKRFGINMKKQLNAYSKVLEQSPRSSGSNIQALHVENPMQARQANCLYRLSNAPLYSETATEYFSSGEIMFQRLIEELKKAKHFIFLEFFIIGEGLLWDTVLDILEQKAKEGVEIRVMYDDAGCIQTLPEGYDSILRQKGIETVVFNPLQPRLNTFLNYRDHRKICVIDGNVGFTGGVNLADEYINYVELHGYWKDTGIMLKGRGVQGLTNLFLQLWQFSTGKTLDSSRYTAIHSYPCDGLVQPFGDDPMNRGNPSKTAYMQLIQQASDFVYIASPYLILDDEMCSCLQTATLSGVDVRIITPHIPDKWYVHQVTRSFYGPLLKAGVRIFEYTPGFIHAKMILTDDQTAVIGSPNMDYRSFYLNFECAVALYHCSSIDTMKKDFLETQNNAQEIQLEEHMATPLPIRFLRALFRLLAPLM